MRVRASNGRMSEEVARLIIAHVLNGTPAAVSRSIKRLCAVAGLQAVGETVLAVFMARSAQIIGGQKHGTVDDPGGAEGRRTRGLEALDEAIRKVQPHLYHAGDGALRRALGALLPPIREAGRHASPKPNAGRPRLGRGRGSLVQCFRDLGATDHEAEAIVSAVRGMPAEDILEPPDIADPS